MPKITKITKANTVIVGDPHTHVERAIKNFQKAACLLRDCAVEARKIWPKAELYLANNNLHLMSGPHHEGNSAKPCPDRILSSFNIPMLDAGDW